MTNPYASNSTDSAPPESAPIVRNVIGWALVAIAFAFALISALRIDNAFQAGQQVGRLVGSGLFIALIAWLITRNRSRGARANALIVSGVLLCLVAVGNLGTIASEKKIGQKFLRDAIALNEVHTQKFQVLNDRFTRVDMSNLLTPVTITSKAGIAAGREKVAQSKELVAARDALLHQNFEDIRKLVADLPDGATKTEAQATIGKKREETIRVFKELSKAQNVHLDLIVQILDWSEAQGSKLKNVGGQLQYTTMEQGNQLQALLDKLTAAEKVADKAFAAASRVEQKAEEKRVEGMKRAKELLK